LLSPERVPRSLVILQGTLLGGTSRFWLVPVFILNGQFPDGFPQNEEHVPFDDNPHPVNGVAHDANPNAPQG